MTNPLALKDKRVRVVVVVTKGGAQGSVDAIEKIVYQLILSRPGYRSNVWHSRTWTSFTRRYTAATQRIRSLNAFCHGLHVISQ